MTDPILQAAQLETCAECAGAGCECCSFGRVEVLRDLDAEDVKPFGRSPFQLDHPERKR